MRITILITLLCMTAVAAADPIDTALDVSRLEHKPLVIVVDDSSCTTCDRIDPTTIPNSDVTIITFDLADKTLGAAVGKRFGAHAGVLVIRDGIVAERYSGHLAIAIRRATDLAPKLPRLRAAVANDPLDPAARLALADYYVDANQGAASVDEYKAYLKLAPPAANVQTWSRVLELLAKFTTSSDVIDARVAFVTALPGDPAIVPSLLALESAYGRDKLLPLVRPALAALPEESLAPVIRLAARLGDQGNARAAIVRWKSLSPEAAKVWFVEVAWLSGLRQEALGNFTSACEPPPPGYEIQCYALTRALFIDRGPVNMDLEADRGASTKLARDLYDAGKACVSGTTAEHVVVRYVSTDRVEIDTTTTAGACVAKELARRVIAKSTLFAGRTFYVTIGGVRVAWNLDPRPPRTATSWTPSHGSDEPDEVAALREPPMDPIDTTTSGLSAALYGRVGSGRSDAAGFEMRGTLELTDYLVAGVDAATGFGTVDDDYEYSAHGTIGAFIARDASAVGIAAGIGIEHDLGRGAAATSIFEVRSRAAYETLFLHGWLRAVVVDDGMQPPRYELGVSVSSRGTTPIFIGGRIDSRADEFSLGILVGVPFAGVF